MREFLVAFFLVSVIAFVFFQFNPGQVEVVMNLFGFNLITGLIGQRLFALFRREDDHARLSGALSSFPNR
jgi:hypothetical protein